MERRGKGLKVRLKDAKKMVFSGPYVEGFDENGKVRVKVNRKRLTELLELVYFGSDSEKS